MKYSYSLYLLLLIGFSVHAEISFDGTLGQAGVLSPDAGGTIDIAAERGQVRGGNLFHSFDTFDVLPQETANFEAPVNGASIDTVLSRVTGGSPSTIAGTIKSEIGETDMYLLNPAGIVMKDNAKLNIGGSFHATTANTINLQGGGQFGVVNGIPTDSPLTADPVANFGFLDANPTAQLEVIDINSKTPLKVDGRHNLVLSGSDVLINNSSLNAINGDIKIEGTETVELNNSTIKVSSKVIENQDIQNKNINLKIGGPANAQFLQSFEMKDSKILTSSEDVYSVVVDIEATNANIIDSGIEHVETLDIGSDSALRLVTKNNALISKSNIDYSRQVSTIYNSDNNTGRLSISLKSEEGSLHIIDNTEINAQTTGPLQGGFINIVSKGDITLQDSTLLAITTDSASGEAGDINISTDTRLDAKNSSIAAGSLGTGAGGNINISASDSILLSGNRDTERFFAITTEAQRNKEDKEALNNIHITKSNIALNTSLLSLRDQARISLTTYGFGDAGNLDIKADKLSMMDSSLIMAATFGSAADAGQGGSINIDTDTLEVVNSSIAAGSTGFGRGGTINISASENILLSGNNKTKDLETTQDMGDSRVLVPLYSITADARGENFDSRGVAGDVTLSTSLLSLQNQARISLATYGPNTAGTLTITAQKGVTLIDSSAIVSATFSARDGAGDAKDITIHTGDLKVIDSSIVAGSLGSGNGGQIGIEASGNILLSGNNYKAATRQNIGTIPLYAITSDTRGELPGSGRAGGIDINTPRLSLQNNAQISSATFGSGSGGDLTVNVGSLDMTGNAGISARSLSGQANQVIGKAGTISINASEDVSLFDSFIVGNAVNANAGDITLDTPTLTITGTNGSLSTKVSGHGSQAGSIIVTAPHIYISQGGQIDSSASDFGNSGQIILENVKSLNLSSGVISATSTEGQAGSIIIDAQKGNIILEDHSEISTRADNSGVAGVIQVRNVKDFLINENSSVEATTTTIGEQPSGLPSENEAAIRIKADTLTLQNGGQIKTTTQNQRTAGTITLDIGQDLRVTGQLENIKNEEQSGIFSNTEPTDVFVGKAGLISINSPSIYLETHGRIDSSASDLGDSGKIELNQVKNLTLISNAVISATSEGGDAGAIIINALPAISTVDILDNSSISTESNKKAGSITINASDVALSKGKIDSSARSSGNSGEIQLYQVLNLALSDEARISATSEAGNAGSITIKSAQKNGNINIYNSGISTQSTKGGSAGVIKIYDANSISISGATSAIQSTTKGEISSDQRPNPRLAADIQLTANSITLDKGGRVETSTQNSRPAGRITLAVNTLILKECPQARCARIESSSSGTGNAGIIFIHGLGTKEQAGNYQITLTNPPSEPRVTIKKEGEMHLNLPNIEKYRPLVPGDSGHQHFYPAEKILINSKGQISTEADGMGNAGDIVILASTVTIQDGALKSDKTGNLSPEDPTSGNIIIGADVFKLQATKNFDSVADTSSIPGSITTSTKIPDPIVSKKQTPGGSSILIGANRIHLHNATVSAESENTDGGNIILVTTAYGSEEGRHADTIYHTNITATAEGAESNGGNVTLTGYPYEFSPLTLQGKHDPDTTAQYLIVENSEITARANKGRGGNIDIDIDEVFLASGDSLISATSEAGIDGDVDVQGFQPDTRTLAILLQEPVDLSKLLKDCAGNAEQQAWSLLEVFHVPKTATSQKGSDYWYIKCYH